MRFQANTKYTQCLLLRNILVPPLNKKSPSLKSLIWHETHLIKNSNRYLQSIDVKNKSQHQNVTEFHRQSGIQPKTMHYGLEGNSEFKFLISKTRSSQMKATRPRSQTSPGRGQNSGVLFLRPPMKQCVKHKKPFDQFWIGVTHLWREAASSSPMGLRRSEALGYNTVPPRAPPAGTLFRAENGQLKGGNTLSELQPNFSFS